MTIDGPPWSWSDPGERVFAAYSHALGAGLRILKTKTADTGKYSYKYADLGDVLDAVEEALSEKGAHVSQIPSGTLDGAVWTLTTVIVHDSGEWLAFDPVVRPQIRDEQAYGSSLTYNKRYSLVSILGIPVSDDDGATAARTAQAEAETGGYRSTAEAQIHEILGNLPAESSRQIVKDFREEFGKGLSALAVARHGDALAWVHRWIEQPAETLEPAGDEQ